MLTLRDVKVFVTDCGWLRFGGRAFGIQST